MQTFKCDVVGGRRERKKLFPFFKVSGEEQKRWENQENRFPASGLTRIRLPSEAFHGALGKIDFLLASRTDMRFIEFVGKYFLFLTASWTLAYK